MQGPGCFQPGPCAYWVSRPRPASPRRRKVRCFRNGLAAIPQSLPCSSAPQPTRCAGLGWGPRIPDGLLLGGRPRREPSRRDFICSGQMNCPGIKDLGQRPKSLVRREAPPHRRRKVRFVSFPPTGGNETRFLAPPLPTQPAVLGLCGGPIEWAPEDTPTAAGKARAGLKTARPLCVFG